MNRRSFAESLALAAFAPVWGRAELLGLDRLPAGVAPFAERVHGLPSGGSSSLAQALAEIVRLRYGDRLRGGELAAITDQIQTGLDRADLIRRAEQGRGA